MLSRSWFALGLAGLVACATEPADPLPSALLEPTPVSLRPPAQLVATKPPAAKAAPVEAEEAEARPVTPADLPAASKPTPAATTAEPKTCKADPVTNLPIGIALDEIPPGYPVAAGVKRPVHLWQGELPHPEREGRVVQVDAGEVFVVDTVAGALRVYDTSLGVERVIAVGTAPRQVALTAYGAQYVLLANGLVRIEKGSTKLAFTLPVPGEATALLLVSGNNSKSEPFFGTEQAVVGDAAGRQVLGIDAHTGELLWRAKVPGRPRQIARHGQDFVVTLDHGAPRHIALPAELPDGMTLTLPTTALALRTGNPAHAFDSTQGTLHAPWPSTQAWAATAMPDGVGVAHALAVVGDEATVVAADKMGLDPSLVLMAKKVEYYGLQLADPCKSVPVRPLEVSVTRFVGSQSVPTQASLAVRDMATGRSALAAFDQPVDLVHDRQATLLFMVARGTHNVLVLNTLHDDPMRWPIAELRVGQGPIGVAVDSNSAYVVTEDVRAVWRVPLEPLRQVTYSYSQADNSLLPTPLVLQADLTVPLATDALPADVLQGRRLFHTAADPRIAVAGRQACASCHVAGQADGLVWATKLGMRDTPSLAGRLAGTAPYGWTHKHATLDAKIQDAIEHMGGTGLPAEDRAALAAYLLSLAATANPFTSAKGLTSQQKLGKALFEDPEVGCADCHSGPAFTDAKVHDIGTDTWAENQVGAGDIAYATPSLRRVGLTAPYLHDGRAKTLWDVLTMTKDQMGKVSHLTSAEIDALVAYLQTL